MICDLDILIIGTVGINKLEKIISFYLTYFFSVTIFVIFIKSKHFFIQCFYRGKFKFLIFKRCGKGHFCVSSKIFL